MAGDMSGLFGGFDDSDYEGLNWSSITEGTHEAGISPLLSDNERKYAESSSFGVGGNFIPNPAQFLERGYIAELDIEGSMFADNITMMVETEDSLLDIKEYVEHLITEKGFVEDGHGFFSAPESYGLIKESSFGKTEIMQVAIMSIGNNVYMLAYTVSEGEIITENGVSYFQPKQ